MKVQKTKKEKETKAHVSESKINAVKELSDLLKKNKTVMIASIKNLPSAMFQEICKKLRGKAEVRVPKKNLMFKSIDSSGNESVQKLKEYVKDSVAILFSDMDAFDLAGDLIRSKSPTKAKTGQEALDDIEVQPGPTELIPGPAISELGALGIPIQIEKGKIHIKEAKIIVKKGEKITAGAADVMSKLDIKPFSVGFIPLCAFDAKENKIYLEMKIDREGTLKELKQAYTKTLAFAIEIGYANSETIKFLIGKAGLHEKAIAKLISGNTADTEINKEVNIKTAPSDNSNDKIDGVNS
ncbi:MAG: 50S ribosomal protein L10 [Candidatus Pacearchaeota archaeon]